MTQRQRRLKKTLAAVGVGTLVPLTVAGGASAQDGNDVQALLDQKVDADLLSEIEENGDTEAWLRFPGEPNYNAAYSQDAKVDKGEAAVKAAKDFAEESQAEAKAFLDDAGIDYESYWASSTIRVTGDQDLLEDLVTIESIESIVEAPELELVEPEERSNEFGNDVEPYGTEWGLDNINAPDVWDMGFDGTGATVAFIDTGAQFDHPAIVDQYRGNNGDGTFTHDYNFYDVQDACGDEPCDNNGHGTHVTGTMVGDDGGDNQIGVAPGAEWIGVNGCCPSTAALLEAGEWIAAPTDWEGNNPDPSKAPDVVNNSWGTTAPGYDDFYVEIVDLWHAAGVIPVTSLGNGGSACDTAGSPGIYPNALGIGAYDINNEIAGFSARGPGVDGQIKPDISAPGVNVRSSVPGDGYDSYSGTSMAGPHVAGQVALLISAAPHLQGDYDAIYELLTGTAVPTADDQCGSDGDANNVYGHGRVDALEMINNAPIGDIGDVNGSVTDADGAALEGATVVFDNGETIRDFTTDAEGSFDGVLTAGDWDVTVTAFGYDEFTDTVTIEQDTVNELSFNLEQVPSGVATGTVVDGSGHGWPMAATVSTVGGEASTTTDPVTGEFELELPVGQWDLEVTPEYDGYQSVTVEGVDVEDMVIEVPVDSCAAPGYGFDPMGSTFDQGSTPSGWTVNNLADEGYGWEFDAGRSNNTPGSDGFATVDSDAAGTGNDIESELVSPVFDLSSADDPTLYFDQDYNHLGSEATVLFSTDGGDTWEEVWNATSDVPSSTESVDLSEWADATDARVKFHYDDTGSWAWWWQVDNVMIGQSDCGMQDGGLVRGEVTDANDGSALEGAVVSHESGASGTTDAEGDFWMFVPETGEVELTAEMADYGSTSGSVDVEGSGVVTASFEIGTAMIEASTDYLGSAVQQGATWTHTLELTNSGTAEGVVDLSKSNGEFTIMSETNDADAAWLTASPDAVTVPAGESVTVEVVTSAEDLDQPGTYTATLTAEYVSPNESPVIEVSMMVVPRPEQGKLTGLVDSVDCEGNVADLEGAQVQLRDSEGNVYHLLTDEAGSYERWLTADSYTIIVSKDGFAADFEITDVEAGRDNGSSFELAELGC
ncbi:S8 family serine peptidase [Haloglycomyces albus]|uniref:S8 family serine peptidase n=1 Tax=Haloglycomyces albus TaxID=526067 RepID=UPI00046C8E73|nr:S8 family serine peptidase [Haloglycomyces albus]